MTNQILEILLYFITIPLFGILLVIIYNVFTAPRMKNKSVKISSKPKVSILIPARNEENNIGECLSNIINLKYDNYEVIVLNDKSTDNTEKTVKEYIHKNPNIKLVNGAELPVGWKGKNWACYQLSMNADGEYYLFVDADVKLSPNTVNHALYLFDKFGLDVLSVFPTQIEKSFGEKLVVPLMKWLLLSFLPLKQVYSSKNNSFVAANGQFIMFDKNVYNKIGGHKTVANSIVEDMEFARLTKQNGMKIMTALGNDSVFCNMYSDFKSAFWGFSKNYFSGFNISVFAFLTLQLFFVMLFILPYVLIFLNIYFLMPLIIVILSRLLLTYMTKENYVINVLLHPIQMTVLIAVGINSVTALKRKKILWKGREI